jgi:hypothetical protein
MALSPKVSVKEDITLIVLQDCPPELNFVADVFQKIGPARCRR